jgi:hypothetical protein
LSRIVRLKNNEAPEVKKSAFRLVKMLKTTGGNYYNHVIDLLTCRNVNRDSKMEGVIEEVGRLGFPWHARDEEPPFFS